MASIALFCHFILPLHSSPQVTVSASTAELSSYSNPSKEYDLDVQPIYSSPPLSKSINYKREKAISLFLLFSCIKPPLFTSLKTSVASSTLAYKILGMNHILLKMF